MNQLQASAQKILKQYISQLEGLEDQKKDIADEITAKYAEAKGAGFDVKIMRKVVAARKKSKAEYLEEEALIQTYLAACSWLDTPLGKSDTEGPHLAVVNG